MKSFLVMLQTNSNQPFIFSSPRLREQIGASFEITLLSHWVEERAKGLLSLNELPSSFWVSDSSGKVIVRFTEADGDPKELAKRLIREVTLRALTDAPGLDVTGVFVKASSSAVDVDDLQELDRVFLDYSLNRRPAAARFPQFPFLERADESALPASAPLSDEELDRIHEYASCSLKVPILSDDDGQVPTQTGKDKDRSLSLPSRVKRAWSRSACRLQLREVIARQDSSLSDEEVRDRIANLNEDPSQLERAFQNVSDENGATKPLPELSSVGVIHIDGNGVGAIMRDLGRAFDTVDARLDSLKDAAYERRDNPCSIKDDRFQWFVMEANYRLDGVVNQAVAKAWQTVDNIAGANRLKTLPVVPVLVGGDDVTVYTDGRYAIPFAEAYIRHYERLTGKDDLLKELAVIAGAPEPGSLTASAGVAIVGRNFPFHIAYDLAEGLVSRGKQLGKKPGASPCSTIDFHVLRDATVLDPDETLDEYKGRVQRPFLVGHYAQERIGDATTASSEETPTTTSQTLSSWARILQAVAAFDGKKPDDPTQTTGDPFPRARANRIVKLLAEGHAEKATTKWGDALQNAPSAGLLAKQLKLFPPKSSSYDEARESLEQIKWLLDLIDLSENLPDTYLASRIRGDADISGSAEAADDSPGGHVTIVFTSDWGVSTGVGHAGRTHSKIERCGDDPVVRSTVITGVLREQAMLAARALDGPDEGKWTNFALWLFGQDPNSEPGSTPHPRHVLFSDATPASKIPIHDTVSLSIDPQTGTARDQFLRFTERAAAGILTGTFTLIDEAGAELSDQRTIDAARFLLGVAGLMVRGIGSGRSGGDGECTLLVTNHEVEAREGQSTSAFVTYASDQAKSLRTNLKNFAASLTAKAANKLPAPQQSGTQHQVGTIDGSAAQHSGGHHLILDLTLDSPIVSYEVPFSNEIRSLDFLRGTVLLPWLHRLVSSKKQAGNEAVITNAVTGGHLIVSDALPVIKKIEGLPVPLTLKTNKTPTSDSTITLYGDSPKNKGKIPVRGGYVFYDPKGGDGKEPGTDSQGWYGKPPLRGRQTTAINHETGAASKGQLVLVDALPEGLKMRAHVWVSDELWEAASVSDLLGKTREARLGSRKLTGTFGSVHCTLRAETDDERESRSHFGSAGIAHPTGDASKSANGTALGESAPASSDDQTVSLWFTSDVIAHSAGLGAGGTVDDLIRAFKREGVDLGSIKAASIRHRRVDSWSPADNGPRASRLAIQAGSVIQVSANDENHAKLLELAPFGVGELTAQGYGRFVVAHPLLSIESIEVTKAKLEHFVREETPEGGEEK